MPLGCQVAWHSYRAWESRGYGCWGMVRLSAKGMKQPGCINLVERLVPLLKVQLVITRFLLIGTKRTSKPCILCTQPCSSRPCWYSSSLWSGRIGHSPACLHCRGAMGHSQRGTSWTQAAKPGVSHLFLSSPSSELRHTYTPEIHLQELQSLQLCATPFLSRQVHLALQFKYLIYCETEIYEIIGSKIFSSLLLNIGRRNPAFQGACCCF